MSAPHGMKPHRQEGEGEQKEAKNDALQQSRALDKLFGTKNKACLLLSPSMDNSVQDSFLKHPSQLHFHNCTSPPMLPVSFCCDSGPLFSTGQKITPKKNSILQQGKAPRQAASIFSPTAKHRQTRKAANSTTSPVPARENSPPPPDPSPHRDSHSVLFSQFYFLGKLHPLVHDRVENSCHRENASNDGT